MVVATVFSAANGMIAKDDVDEVKKRKLLFLKSKCIMGVMLVAGELCNERIKNKKLTILVLNGQNSFARFTSAMTHTSWLFQFRSLNFLLRNSEFRISEIFSVIFPLFF